MICWNKKCLNILRDFFETNLLFRFLSTGCEQSYLWVLAMVSTVHDIKLFFSFARTVFVTKLLLESLFVRKSYT